MAYFELLQPDSVSMIWQSIITPPSTRAQPFQFLLYRTQAEK